MYKLMITSIYLAWFSAVLLLASGCTPIHDEVESTAQNLIATHGPLPCDGATPEYGYVDFYSGIYLTGVCERWRGDFSRGSSHIGFKATPSFTPKSIKLSSYYTTVLLCTAGPEGPSYAPCGYYPAKSVGYGSTAPVQNYLPFVPTRFYIGEYALCPYLADRIATQNHTALPYLHAPDNGPYPEPQLRIECGLWFDGSYLEQFVATDGYGNPIHLFTVSGFGGECIGDDDYGNPVVMAYSCDY